MDADLNPGDPKTYESYESGFGSATLPETKKQVFSLNIPPISSVKKNMKNPAGKIKLQQKIQGTGLASE